LQAVDKQRIPVKNLAMGAIVKIVLTYVLVGIPSLNVKGAALSTIAAYLTAAALNYWDINKHTEVKVSLLKIAIRPLIASSIMGVVVYVVYHGGADVIGVKLAALLAILGGVVVYFIALPITGTINKEDMDLLPKGEKLYKLMNKLKLMK
jgi:stage V sporulation protein B